MCEKVLENKCFREVASRDSKQKTSAAKQKIRAAFNFFLDTQKIDDIGKKY